MALDPAEKKVALRAINYGLYVLTAAENGEYGAGGVNWVTQASFDPPLIVAAMKADSDSHRIILSTGGFAVNVLGDDQFDIGKAFFRTTKVDGDTLNGYRFEPGPETGCPAARRPAVLVRGQGHRHDRPRRPHGVRRRGGQRRRARCREGPAACCARPG